MSRRGGNSGGGGGGNKKGGGGGQARGWGTRAQSDQSFRSGSSDGGGGGGSAAATGGQGGNRRFPPRGGVRGGGGGGSGSGAGAAAAFSPPPGFGPAEDAPQEASASSEAGADAPDHESQPVAAPAPAPARAPAASAAPKSGGPAPAWGANAPSVDVKSPPATSSASSTRSAAAPPSPTGSTSSRLSTTSGSSDSKDSKSSSAGSAGSAATAATGSTGSAGSAGSAGSLVPADDDNKRLKDLVAPRQKALKVAPNRMFSMITNSFRVTLKPKTLWRFTVEFDPHLDPSGDDGVKRRIAVGKCRKRLEERVGMFTFDGISLFALRPSEKEIVLSADEKDAASQQIRLVPSADAIDTKDTQKESVQMVLNSILKRFLKALALVQFGREYYERKSVKLRDQIRGGEGLELHTGFAMALGRSLAGLTITVDMAYRVRQEQTVRQYLNRKLDELWDENYSDKENMEYIAGFVREEITGQTVMLAYSNRTYRIDDIDWIKTIDSKFDRPEGPISFREYYKKAYGAAGTMTGKPEPGLIVHFLRKKRIKRKGEVKNENEEEPPIYLMPELAYLTGMSQAQREKSPLMKEFAKFSRMSADKRVTKITGLMNSMLLNPVAKGRMNEFGIEVSASPLKVACRAVGPFHILIGPQNRKTEVRGAQQNFSNEIRDAGFIPRLTQDQKLLKPVLGDWLVIYPKNLERDSLSFAARVSKLAAKQGASWGAPQQLQLPASNPEWKSTIDGYLKAVTSNPAKKPSFVLAVVPNGDEHKYSMVKSLFTVERGFISQCVRSNQFMADKLDPVAGNIFKQIMAKLGWYSWRLDLPACIREAKVNPLLQPTMMVGVDVCHDKKVQGTYGNAPKGNHSWVGFCASYDRQFTQYASWSSYQQKGLDKITHAKMFMEAAVKMFHAKNNVYPQNVIVYRDGVSNSQLETFVRHEVRDFEAAFRQFNLKVKLTVIVVQKRITNRLFFVCPGPGKCYLPKCNGSEAYHSPPPGSVVNEDMTSSEVRDFFLVPSIAPPAATARPTRFIVVKDEVGFSQNDIEDLTNTYCMAYQNWQGPIRVPAPVMYSHKLAYFFGKHVNPGSLRTDTFDGFNQSLQDRLFYL